MNKRLEYMIGAELPFYLLFISWLLAQLSLFLAYAIISLIQGISIFEPIRDVPTGIIVISALSFYFYFNYVMSDLKENKIFPFHERKRRKKKQAK